MNRETVKEVLETRKTLSLQALNSFFEIKQQLMLLNQNVPHMSRRDISMKIDEILEYVNLMGYGEI